MERRGFIGKFARATAGALLSAKELLSLNDNPLEFRRRLVTIVKVQDETLYGTGGLNRETLKAMFQAGLPAVYPDISPDEFLRTLFPGLVDEGLIGVKVYGEPEAPEEIKTILDILIEVLCELHYGERKLGARDFIVWGGKDIIEEIHAETAYQVRFQKDEPPDPALDAPLELGEFTLIPSPLLSRICQFQLGLVFFSPLKKETTVCRDAYLSCFLCDKSDYWPQGWDDETLDSVYEKMIYPLEMKFRLFIVQAIGRGGGLYLASYPNLLDNFLSRISMEDKVNLLEINNPTAPLVNEVSWARSGEDIEIKWSDEGYEGEYQVYRGGEEGFVPGRVNLVGITRNKVFRDFRGVYLGKCFYKVTRAWGGV